MGLEPGGRAAGDEPATDRERGHALLEGPRPGVLEHDLHAPPLGEALDLDQKVLPLVVWNQLVGAERLGLLELGLGACGGQHPGPAGLAIWMAALPTPLPAAWTSTVSPAPSLARFTSISQAVRKVRGMQAASGNERLRGMGTRFARGTHTYSAYPPRLCSPMMW